MESPTIPPTARWSDFIGQVGERQEYGRPQCTTPPSLLASAPTEIQPPRYPSLPTWPRGFLFPDNHWATEEADDMSDSTTYLVTARLAPRSDTAALLRIISILHSRCANVRHLTYDIEDEGGATLTARVTLSNAGWLTLQESLRRPVEVLDVVTDVDQPLELVGHVNG